MVVLPLQKFNGWEKEAQGEDEIEKHLTPKTDLCRKCKNFEKDYVSRTTKHFQVKAICWSYSNRVVYVLFNGKKEYVGYFVADDCPYFLEHMVNA